MALCALLVVDELVGRRYGSRHSAGDVVRRLCYLAAGMLIVVIPVMVCMLVTAGAAPLFEQLVVLPVTGYRTALQTSWGAVDPLTVGLAQYTVSVVLK
jgi:hypothetical protein